MVPFRPRPLERLIVVVLLRWEVVVLSPLLSPSPLRHRRRQGWYLTGLLGSGAGSIGPFSLRFKYLSTYTYIALKVFDSMGAFIVVVVDIVVVSHVGISQ